MARVIDAVDGVQRRWSVLGYPIGVIYKYFAPDHCAVVDSPEGLALLAEAFTSERPLGVVVEIEENALSPELTRSQREYLDALIKLRGPTGVVSLTDLKATVTDSTAAVTDSKTTVTDL